ncbi:MAG: right-handed parallel beta-helix repeat-containing protein [Planctomycetota bacterium]|jgi:predicted outer membrane repeat protein
MKKKDRKWRIAVIVLVLGMGGASFAGQIIYVDANAPGSNDGSSWADAFNYLQDALAEANSNPDVNEIRVAHGIFTPDCNSAAPAGTGDRTAAFQLIDGVVLKGGYAGFGAPDPNARDVDAYKTTLSGDLNGDDGPNFANIGENSYHVLICNGTDGTAVIDGFTIVGGNADYGFTWPPDSRSCGGGIYNDRGSPNLVNCTFSKNLAGVGGGMYNTGEYGDCNPALKNCTFIGNCTHESGGGGGMYNYGFQGQCGPILIDCTFNRNSTKGLGGGIYNFDSSPNLTNCTFHGNSASNDGGGIYNDGACAPILTKCTFSNNIARSGAGMCSIGLAEYEGYPVVVECLFADNSASDSGGGMANESHVRAIIAKCTFAANSAQNFGGGMHSSWGAKSTVTNCVFSGNSVGQNGGAMYCWARVQVVITNCTFVGNSAINGRTLVCDYDVHYWYRSNVEFTNCILRDDGNEIWDNDGSTVTIAYTNVQGGQAAIYDPCGAVICGQGNIEADPCFAEPGYWDSNGTPDDVNDDYWVEGDYHLKSEGGRWDPNSESWVLDDVTSACIDKGDWSSPIGDEPYPNGGRVNMGAYGGTAEASKSPVITCWEAGECAGQRYGDATCDGVPSLADLFALKAYFGKRAPWTDPECCVDFNHDDSVNLADLFILRFNFGSGPYSPSTLNQNCPP